MPNFLITMTYRWTAFALLLAACQTKAPPPPPSSGSGSGSGSGSADVQPKVIFDELRSPDVKLPMQTAFEVVDAGTGEKAPLRYAPAAEMRSYLAATSLKTRRLTNNTWSDLVTTPTVTTGIALIPVAAGTLSGRALAAEGPADSADAKAMMEAWKPIDNRRFSLPFDERGQVGDPTFLDDPNAAVMAPALADLQQRDVLTFVPVPADPVGVGASWRVITVLRQGPFIVKQTALYTLTARTKDAWKIDAQIQRVGEPQPVKDASVPPDTAVELVLLNRHYAGALTIDPTTVMPTGTLEIDSMLHLRISSAKIPMAEEMVEDQGTITLTSKL